MSMISGRKARGGGSRAPGEVPATGGRTTSRARRTAVRALPVAAAAAPAAPTQHATIANTNMQAIRIMANSPRLAFRIFLRCNGTAPGLPHATTGATLV